MTRRSAQRGLRIAAWNLSLAALGAAAVAAIGEGYLRASAPFMTPSYAYVHIPGVGSLLRPGSVVRHTNKLDFWATTRINRWGFADREPLPRSRTEAGCHIAVIGDSFVEALEVPMAAKMHVQLERYAAEELPHLRVSTSAFGRGNTGQAAQLPYYDRYARTLKPKLVVLVFTYNDFNDNYYGPSWQTRIVPTAHGALRLLPPDPESKHPHVPLGRRSFLAAWLKAKQFALRKRGLQMREPNCLDCVRFALQQFTSRVQRDHASLVILSNYEIDRATGTAEWLRNAAGGVPVVSLARYLAARNGSRQDVRWDHDYHWNPTGHLWAARALLEYLRSNENVCLAKLAAYRPA